MDRPEKTRLCGAAGEMSVDLETRAEESSLAASFQELRMDNVVIMACGTGFVVVGQIEANIARMLGYSGEEAWDYLKNLPDSIGRVADNGYLASYDGETLTGSLRMYRLTQKGRERKVEIFNKIVESLPKKLRQELLEKAK